MSPLCQRLTLRDVAPEDADHRLDRVGRLQRRAQVPGDPQPGERDGLLEALAQRRGGAGMVVIKLGGEAPQAVQRASVVVLGPRCAQLMLDAGPVRSGR